LNEDQVVKIARLTICKNFVGKRKKFIFNAFVDLKPMERFENGSDMYGLGAVWQVEQSGWLPSHVECATWCHLV